jgi:hypothetical protein
MNILKVPGFQLRKAELQKTLDRSHMTFVETGDGPSAKYSGARTGFQNIRRVDAEEERESLPLHTLSGSCNTTSHLCRPHKKL